MRLDAEDERYLLAMAYAEEHMSWARRDGQSPYVIVALLRPEWIEEHAHAITWLDALLAISQAWLALKLPMLVMRNQTRGREHERAKVDG